MEQSIVQQDDGKIVSLIGVINEDSELSFKNLFQELKDDKKITFNFSQVKSINSLGVRAWVSFLRSLEDGKTILFSECTRENVFRISGRRTGESAATSHAPMQPYPYAVNSCFALIPKP